ncbi:MAG: hypothetical protein H6772_03720 [Pseudomonadales bacterium]|nr:hypothetical protein [Pseudomonadales bacterium]
MFKDLSKKIIFTIAYTDQFQYPLTKEEIYLRIIGNHKKVSFKFFENLLKKLVTNDKISLINGLYFLKGSEKTVGLRVNRNAYSQIKWGEAEDFVKLVKFIPWIKGVAVTGSLAVNNARKNDDIDFLIVTQNSRLWLTRIIIVLIAQIKGRKRSWDNEEANSWCLNLWLEEKTLKLPNRLKNIYGAFEVCQAIWIYEKGNTKSMFFQLNNWVIKYLPNFYLFQKNNNDKLISVKNSSQLSALKYLLDVLNQILFYLQFLYMKPHMTKESVGVNFAFFHPRDTKKLIFSKWFRKFSNYTI